MRRITETIEREPTVTENANEVLSDGVDHALHPHSHFRPESRASQIWSEISEPIVLQMVR
jgi:hypothetical protein